MRISNIANYLGGADAVIAREVLEGNQFKQALTTDDGTDFSDVGTVFTIKTELFSADVSYRNSIAEINSLTKEADASVFTYVKGDVISLDGVNAFTLTVPSTLLSDFNGVTTYKTTADTTTPLVVVMKLQWASAGITQSVRFLFLMRYQPTV